jgi:hypothetical protein
MVHSVLEASYKPNLKGRAQRKGDTRSERVCELSIKEDSVSRSPKESEDELESPRATNGRKPGEYADEAQRND